MANTYDIGDIARISATFTDTGGTLVDPSDVKFSWNVPGSTATTVVTKASLNNPSSGLYNYDITVTSTGVWYYQIASTGTYRQVEEDYFLVHALQVTT